MGELRLHDIKKSFGAIDVIKGVDLEIKSGEFVVFVGPSGCGKSTLLRLIAGLEEITSGTLEFDGEEVNELPPALRGIAMVFQSYALYPHMTVYNNMAFGMKLAKVNKAEIDKSVRQAAEVLQLTPYLDRLPKQLSGGQRQRVAIGRAIVRNPKVFLFDEPLSNLDAALRVSMRIEIAKLHERMSDVTMVYVTHDQVEAMTLADRIVVLRAGLIEQVGSPMQLYERPDNLFVAGFIGSPAMNMVPCIVEAGAGDARVRPEKHGSVGVKAKIPASAVGQKGTLGVRPENLSLANGAQPIFKGRLDILEHLGELTLLYVDCGYAEPIIAKIEGNVQIKRDSEVALTAPASVLHVFDEKGKAFERIT
jgi:alpha-glucoside transport system ATP-binding protein